jgi:hypothetical protein
MTPTWDDVTEELAGWLARLRDGDALSLDVGPYFVQFKRFGPQVAVIASGTGAGLPEEARLSPEQARRMEALGWEPPGVDVTHRLPDLPRPVSLDTARGVAALMVTTVRDVYGADAPADATFSSHSDRGHHPPTLTTVAVGR